MFGERHHSVESTKGRLNAGTQAPKRRYRFSRDPRARGILGSCSRWRGLGDASSASGSTVDLVSRSSDNSIEQLEHQLEGAERTLSGVGALSDQQAERVAQRMDRLASQLLNVSAPSPIDVVHERLGTRPASREELESLADRMGAPDGEG
ncbi:MAG: hypothetical protein ACR2ML_01170 [Solirubrobacteraceae bacterium]